MQMQIIIDRFLRSEKSQTYKLNCYEKIILHALSSYMGDKLICWPSYKSLEKYCSLSKWTLIKNIKSLEEKNILKVTRNKKINNSYEFYPQVVANSYQVVANSYQVVANSYPNNIINNIINNNKDLIKKETNPVDNLKQTKSTVKFWEPGNPDYDRVNKK